MTPTAEPGRRRSGALVWALLAMLLLVAGVVAAIVLMTNSGSGSTARSATGAHAGRPTRKSHDPSAATRPRKRGPSTAAPPTSTPTTTAAATSAPTAASTPASAVEAFYERAARHDYAGAWALANDTMRAQLGGYASFQAQMSRVRSITFHEATTITPGASSPATVAVRTTSTLTTRTESCSGTARTVRQGGTGSRWVLDRIGITCTPA